MVDDVATGKDVSSQRTFLVDKQRMQYEGIFIIHDLYKLVSEYFEEKGYDKREAKNAEIVRDDGLRFIEIQLEPWKKITDYAKAAVKVRMIMENVKDIEIEKEGLKVHAHQGTIKFLFDCYVDTEYENRWGKKTTHTAIRVLFDKYFFKRYTQQYFAEALDDYKMLIYQIKVFLNMHQE